jgi:hypothetical protein
LAIVFFSSELKLLTGEEQTRSDAAIFKDIVTDLVARYDRLSEEKLMEMAIAIDGEIIHTPLLEHVGKESELHFLHRISGG